MTLMGAGVLTLRHGTVLFHLSVHGDRNELVNCTTAWPSPAAGLFGVLLRPSMLNETDLSGRIRKACADQIHQVADQNGVACHSVHL